jgi:tetratricopeptide (TPR) repeat protein
MPRFESLEAAIESFIEERRSGSSIGAREFGSRHAYLGPDLIDALESLEMFAAARPPVFAHPLRPGAQIGAYRIVREIGRGGMGVVFEAIEQPLGRRVALKCLPPEAVSRPSARARFEREAAITSQLDHSGICTVYSAGVSEDQAWIAMRFVEGETLAERIAAARAGGERWLSLPEASGPPRARVLAIAHCIARVARALTEAHARGFVHRDVKPSNVMITPAGEPVLLDFGLASAADADAGLTRTGDLPGTPTYLAPETISGGFSPPDARCDVYSLGVTLYECLALAPPFSGPTRDALYHAILSDAPPPIADPDSALPRDLHVVLATALERDRSRRYAEAADLAADLERVVAGLPITARPISAVGRAARWMKREPRQAGLAVGLAIAALGLAVLGGIHLASRNRVQAAEALLSARDVEHRLVEAYHALALDDHARAETAFDDALSRDAANVEALAGRVLVSIDRHDADEARRRLERAPALAVFADLRALADGRALPAVETLPLADVDAFRLFVSGTRLRRALITTPRSERPALAKQAYRRLTEAVLHSSTPRPLYYAERAFAASYTKDVEAARSAASSLLTQWPDDPGGMFAAAIALSDVDQAASTALLERVVELKPDFGPAWGTLAYRRSRAEQYQEGVVAGRTALRLNPRSFDALSATALCYTYLRCPEEARPLFARAVAVRPNTMEGWANWAQLELNEKQYELAADLLARGLACDVRDPQMNWWRGRALGLLERWPEARPHFELAVAFAPDNPAMWQGLLSATTALDDVDATELAVGRALELEPNNPQLAALSAQLARLRKKR